MAAVQPQLGVDCSANSGRATWLRNDLAPAGAGKDNMAYLHRPRFSCGHRGSSALPSALWNVLLTAAETRMRPPHDSDRTPSSGTQAHSWDQFLHVGTGTRLTAAVGGHRISGTLTLGPDTGYAAPR